jgi:hypothetical protein
MEPAHTFDWKSPARHWGELTEHDRQRYNELRLFFRQQQKEFLRARKSSPFAGEIVTVLSYIDQPTPGRDSRCIMCGIACGGPLLCVNAQQLKHLVGRCKSSINTCFQQIGYGVLRNREKGREAIWAIIPELRSDPGAIRQWTVRCANETCAACFCSSFAPRSLPEVSPEDFTEEKKPARQPQPVPWSAHQPARVTFEPPRPAPRPTTQWAEFGFGTVANEGEGGVEGFQDFPPSFSVDFLSGIEPEQDVGPDPLASFFEPKPGPHQQPLPRSQSVDPGFRFQ